MARRKFDDPDHRLPLVFRLLMGWNGILAVVAAALPFVAWTPPIFAVAEELLTAWIALWAGWSWFCHRAALRRVGKEVGVGSAQAAIVATLSTLLLPVWATLSQSLLCGALARHCQESRPEAAPRFGQLANQARALLGFGLVWSVVAIFFLRSAMQWAELRGSGDSTPFRFHSLHGVWSAVLMGLALATWPCLELWWLSRTGPTLWKQLQALPQAPGVTPEVR